jgi:hypothetical protein
MRGSFPHRFKIKRFLLANSNYLESLKKIVFLGCKSLQEIGFFAICCLLWQLNLALRS